MRILTRL